MYFRQEGAVYGVGLRVWWKCVGGVLSARRCGVWCRAWGLVEVCGVCVLGKKVRFMVHGLGFRVGRKWGGGLFSNKSFSSARKLGRGMHTVSSDP